MQDTSPEFRRLVRERPAQMTPMERLRACADMFDTARMLVEASLSEGLDPMDRRLRICGRFYGEPAARACPRRVA